jgi:hypothetical protein
MLDAQLAKLPTLQNAAPSIAERRSSPAGENACIAIVRAIGCAMTHRRHERSPQVALACGQISSRSQGVPP